MTPALALPPAAPLGHLTIASPAPLVILDAEKHAVACTASTSAVDAEDDIIRPRGWRLGRVAKGAVPLLNCHRGGDIRDVLGNVPAAALEQNGLRCIAHFAVDINPLAALAWKLAVGEFLRTLSVGFKTLHAVFREDIRDETTGKLIVKADPELWAKVVAEMGLDPAYAARATRIITVAELAELSVTGVPANPDAMMKALHAGAIAERDMAACGITGDVATLVETGAHAWDRLTAPERTALNTAITKAMKFQQPPPAGADNEARRLASATHRKQRDALLEKVRALTNEVRAITTKTNK